jgi:hypothetical protein
MNTDGLHSACCKAPVTFGSITDRSGTMSFWTCTNCQRKVYPLTEEGVDVLDARREEIEQHGLEAMKAYIKEHGH